MSKGIDESLGKRVTMPVYANGHTSYHTYFIVAPHAKALEQLDKGYDKDNAQYFEVLVGATVPREGLQYGVIPGSEQPDVFPVGDKTPQSSNADDSDE